MVKGENTILFETKGYFTLGIYFIKFETGSGSVIQKTVIK